MNFPVVGFKLSESHSEKLDYSLSSPLLELNDGEKSEFLEPQINNMNISDAETVMKDPLLSSTILPESENSFKGKMFLYLYLYLYLLLFLLSSDILPLYAIILYFIT